MTDEICPACGTLAMALPAPRANATQFARCRHCGHGRKLITGQSPLSLAMAVEDREPSTPAEWLLAHLPPSTRNAARLDVLDIGCWDGSLLAGLPAGWRRRGIEPNPSAAARARAAGLEIDTSSLADSQLDTEAYDLVVMLDVLEHMDGPRAAFTRIHELLRAGGIFAALTGDGGSFGARTFGDRWYYRQYPEHISFFTRRSLTTLLVDTGFESVVERVGHPMSGHAADLAKVAGRIRTALGGEPRPIGSSSLNLGPNLATASRLLRGRDHLWAVARKAKPVAGGGA